MKFQEIANGFIMDIDLALAHFDTAHIKKGETIIFDGHEYGVYKIDDDVVYFLALD